MWPFVRTRNFEPGTIVFDGRLLDAAFSCQHLDELRLTRVFGNDALAHLDNREEIVAFLLEEPPDRFVARYITFLERDVHSQEKLPHVMARASKVSQVQDYRRLIHSTTPLIIRCGMELCNYYAACLVYSIESLLSSISSTRRAGNNSRR